MGLHLVTSQLEAQDLSAVLHYAGDWIARCSHLGPVVPADRIAHERDTSPIPGATDGE